MFSMEYCEVMILNAVYTFSHNIFINKKNIFEAKLPFFFLVRKHLIVFGIL